MILREILCCAKCGKSFLKLRHLNSHIKIKEHGNRVSLLEGLISLGVREKTALALIENIKLDPFNRS